MDLRVKGGFQFKLRQNFIFELPAESSDAIVRREIQVRDSVLVVY